MGGAAFPSKGVFHSYQGGMPIAPIGYFVPLADGVPSNMSRRIVSVRPQTFRTSQEELHPMVDFLLGLAFVAMILTPAVVATIQHGSRNEDEG
jgi:hypothetical protein